MKEKVQHFFKTKVKIASEIKKYDVSSSQLSSKMEKGAKRDTQFYHFGLQRISLTILLSQFICLFLDCTSLVM